MALTFFGRVRSASFPIRLLVNTTTPLNYTQQSTGPISTMAVRQTICDLEKMRIDTVVIVRTAILGDRG
jgi:hypothetical protein